MIVVACAVAQELLDFAPPVGVELLVTGVGPVEAASVVARRLARGDVTALVSVGIAGAFAGRGAVGDAVLVREERYLDLGLEGGGALALPPGIDLAKVVAADAALLALAAGCGARTVTGITSAAVTATDARAARIDAAYAPGVETMEGFAVLRAAEHAAVAAIELRGISNRVGDRATNGWDFLAGARAARGLLDAYLTRLLTNER